MVLQPYDGELTPVRAGNFLIVPKWKIHKLREMRMLFHVLLLAGMGELTGCITAGGKPVGPVAMDGDATAVAAGPLSADEIVERFRKAEKVRGLQAEAGVVYAFDRNILIEDFDSEGKLKRRQTRKFRSFTDNRIPELLLHDGKPPTPEQVEKERKKISEHKLKFLGTGSPDNPEAKGDANLLLRQIELYGDHFLPRLLGTGPVHGRPAYILQFLFDPDNRFKDPLVNIALKHMFIKVWIDQSDFQIAKLEAELINPLYAIGGLAGKLETFTVTAHQKRLTPKIWADWKVNARANGWFLWKTDQGESQDPF